jgi:hypothetical protein
MLMWLQMDHPSNRKKHWTYMVNKCQKKIKSLYKFICSHNLFVYIVCCVDLCSIFLLIKCHTTPHHTTPHPSEFQQQFYNIPNKFQTPENTINLLSSKFIHKRALEIPNVSTTLFSTNILKYQNKNNKTHPINHQ